MPSLPEVRSRGQLPDSDFLKALIEDGQLAWLKPLTALVVRLEEQDFDFQKQLRTLLIPDAGGSEFQRKYAEAIKRSPDVVVAHGKTIRVFKELL